MRDGRKNGHVEGRGRGEWMNRHQKRRKDTQTEAWRAGRKEKMTVLSKKQGQRAGCLYGSLLGKSAVKSRETRQ